MKLIERLGPKGKTIASLAVIGAVIGGEAYLYYTNPNFRPDFRQPIGRPLATDTPTKASAPVSDTATPTILPVYATATAEIALILHPPTPTPQSSQEETTTPDQNATPTILPVYATATAEIARLNTKSSDGAVTCANNTLVVIGQPGISVDCSQQSSPPKSPNNSSPVAPAENPQPEPSPNPEALPSVPVAPQVQENQGGGPIIIREIVQQPVYIVVNSTPTPDAAPKAVAPTPAGAEQGQTAGQQTDVETPPQVLKVGVEGFLNGEAGVTLFFPGNFQQAVIVPDPEKFDPGTLENVAFIDLTSSTDGSAHLNQAISISGRDDDGNPKWAPAKFQPGTYFAKVGDPDPNYPNFENFTDWIKFDLTALSPTPEPTVTPPIPILTVELPTATPTLRPRPEIHPVKIQRGVLPSAQDMKVGDNRDLSVNRQTIKDILALDLQDAVQLILFSDRDKSTDQQRHVSHDPNIMSQLKNLNDLDDNKLYDTYRAIHGPIFLT